jgi:hypothetical protein
LTIAASVRVAAAGGPGLIRCVAEESATLIASDRAPGDGFGFSVSVCEDVAIVGAYNDDDGGPDCGSAYIYRRVGGDWVEEAELLPSTGGPNDWFGYAVAVTGDMAIVGAQLADDNGLDSGAAYIYRLGSAIGGWIEEAKLVASDGAAGEWFGCAVALSGDVALIGATCDDDNGGFSGSAYVYRFDGARWIEEAKLLPSDGGRSDSFGYSVALKLYASDAGMGDLFGYAVAVDDSLAVIGAVSDDDNGSSSGSAYVFRHDGEAWAEEAKILPSDGAARADFGGSVAIAGETVIIGAEGDDGAAPDSGSAYVYRFDGSEWVEHAKLRASYGGGGDRLGVSVATDGVTIIAGAVGDDDRGSASLFPLHSLCSETVCPDEAGNFYCMIGGSITGDALDLCASDDVRLEVQQAARLSPFLPVIQLEYWAHSTFGNGAISSVEYVIEGHVSARVPGGQSPDTLRTSIMNYRTGLFEMVDQRATGPDVDETINHEQSINAPDYVETDSGEVCVRQDVFEPGRVISEDWSLEVDRYDVTVNR